MGTPTPSRARLLVARIRMPFLAVSALAFLAAAILDVPGWLALVALGLRGRPGAVLPAGHAGRSDGRPRQPRSGGGGWR